MKTFSLSNVGKVRAENEDSVYISESKTDAISAVADGMGGHAAGKTASGMTVSFFEKAIREKNGGKFTDDELRELVKKASDLLISASKRDEALKDMGTTLVMALADEKSAKIVNVGDSRAYILNKRKLRLVTHDHSLVQYLVDSKMLTQQEAETNPYRHVIMRAIGMENVKCDIFNVDFECGDLILLCSDGLTEHVKDKDIEQILLSEGGIAEKAKKLVNAALERGGSDNVTVALIENDSLIGRTLQNRYKLTEEIAEGGMSYVYSAITKKTNERVAVKIFKNEMLDNPAAFEGFKREVFICSKLHHKNLVHTIDAGKHDGLRYIVMEYIDGTPLNEVIHSGGMDIHKSVDTVIKLLGALSYAHSRGVIHKDLKPQNIIMRDGEPVIIDFGIAEDKTVGEDSDNRVLGTIDYFSPEQAIGESVDLRSDLYSIGIMLYEMLTGRVPFSGRDNVSVAIKHIHQPAEPPKSINAEIPESLNKLVMKAISKDKEERYPNAAMMAQDLRRVFSEPDGAYIQTEDERREAAKKNQKKISKKIIIGVGCAVLAIIGAITAMVFYITGRFSQNTPEAYMPYLVDMELEEAAEMIDSMNMDLKLDVTYEIRLDYDEDVVVYQTPSEGAALTAGDTVSVTVSSLTLKGGIMPNVIGMNESTAIVKIKAANIESPTVFYESVGASDIDKDGKVFKQYPEEGTVVTDSVVIYVYEYR